VHSRLARLGGGAADGGGGAVTTGQLARAPAQRHASRPEAVVRVEGLVKRFPKRPGWRALLRHPLTREYATVLDAVTLEVAAGEFFGLLGPNGAGKTTLFKILSTLVEPDAGRAWVNGFEVRAEPAAVRLQLAPVVPEERSLNWRLTGRQNLAVYGALHGLHGAASRRRIAELLAVVELEPAADRMVAEYSSGMRQRLLLARALLARPRVLLLDEPTRSLDPVSARGFRAFLRDEVVGRQGCTVLLATHSPEEAFELCGRVGVLDRGRLLATGAPDALAHRYAGDRYRLTLRGAADGVLGALEAEGRLRLVVEGGGAAPEADGWRTREATVADGAAGAAAVVAALTTAGVEVALVERVRFTLADLIESIVGGGGTS
jgi:ABC-2 type transport system ATP-binding protein